MSQRCIFLIAESGKLDQIQGLRRRFDPIAEKVPPHVTIVFPFELNWDLERLSTLLNAQAAALPISFSLGEPTEQAGYLTFPLVKGIAKVTALHDAVYASLPSSLLSNMPYEPHMTFGRLLPGQRAGEIMEEAARVLPCSGILRRMVLERIGTLDESIVEHEVSWP